MKRFQLLESWHNGCDNAVDELFCESDRRDNIAETLNALTGSIKSDGLGPDFPSGEPKVTYGTDEVRFYLGDDPVTPEFFRSFRIVEVGRKWDFVWEQESLNPAFPGFYTGIISDGEDFLFFRANREDNLCEVFASIEEMCEDGPIVSYPWSAENDSLLLETLDATPFDRIVNRGMCDHSASALRQVVFLDGKDCVQ